MQVRAALLDFDGTIVNKDTLVELTSLNGMRSEAEQSSRDFQQGKTGGLDALIAQINMLKGLSVERIKAKVLEDLCLVDGAREFFRYCKRQHIVTILASGTIASVADIYQRELGIDYVVCSHPKIADGRIVSIAQDDYLDDGRHFKVVGITALLESLGISTSECIAVGDGRGDIPMFELANYAYAINPKGGIEEYSDEVVSDLYQVVQSMTFLGQA